MLNFSPYSTLCKNPQGAVTSGTKVGFYALLPRNRETFYPIVFAMQKDGEHWVEYACSETSETENADKLVGIEWTAQGEGIYFYKFFARRADGTILDETQVHQQTVYNSSFMTPKWLWGGLMYQIFPDRFNRSDKTSVPQMNKDWVLRDNWGEDPISGPDERGIVKNNDFFGGNLKGIEEYLPYLEELGVTIIYLNPIFESYSNHRYDTANYMKIDPLLGTEEDFRDLCSSAKSKGIRIILDGVFNHTGSHSIYFNKDGAYDALGAYQSKDSPYFNWYSFSNWPDEYASWWGIDTLPGLCEEQPEVLDYIINNAESVIAHWLSAGASGFRLDVADELPDGFLDALRVKVKSIDPQACIIGEVWEDATTKIAYNSRRSYFLGNQLDSVMNYPLKDSIIRFLTGESSGLHLEHLVNNLKDHYPSPAFNCLMNILGTHDTHRIRTLLSQSVSDKVGKQRLFCGLLIWAFMPGTPCIYYGDEIGMQGEKDPMNRRCFEPEWADQDIQKYYKDLLIFRKKISGLGVMDLSEIKGENSLFSFVRKSDKEILYIFINMSAEERVFNIDNSGNIIDQFSSGSVLTYKDRVAVPSESATCIRLQNKT